MDGKLLHWEKQPLLNLIMEEGKEIDVKDTHPAKHSNGISCIPSGIWNVVNFLHL